MSDRFLSIDQVSEVTTLGKTLLWGMVKAGQFPPPRQLSTRRKAWLESEVVAWMQGRPASGMETLTSEV